MAKANLDGVPAEGSRWELDGLPVVLTVDGFKAKGRGGYVLWHTESSVGQKKTKLSEFRSKARAA